MQKNEALDLAWDFIEKTDRSIFLTGKAGTGKTTFLHNLKSKSLKRLVVVAPTGVAAINARGVTIHSFFQMPFGPILPENANTTFTKSASSFQRKFNRNKINIIKSLDLLIIDEISMVRADLLDGIDQVLRRYKDRNKVFGGVQVLMIGDLQQLPPVVKDAEWSLLKPYYKTPYFFSSMAFNKSNAISIELKHIYRQDNKAFIKILNEIRNNTLSKESSEELNKRYLPDFTPTNKDGYITLTTHNNRANSMNGEALQKIKSKSVYYTAKVDGNFPEHTFPTFEELELKVGAQVMFIKNDSSPDKRYFNGKIGTVVFLDKTEVGISCQGEDELIVSTPEIWENVNYSINSETKDISEKIIGSFSQIPLRLAWAITIHKSQGLTFDKAIIDAQASFAHGQTYVALSRCRNLEGVVLKSPIDSNCIINDSTINEFTQNITENEPDSSDLNESHKTFQLNLLEELFNFYAFLYPSKRLIDIYYQNKTSFQGNIIEPLNTIKDEGITKLLQIANAFKIQLKDLSVGILDVENNEQIQERIQKAIVYFLKHSEDTIKLPLDSLSFSSENKAVQQDFNKAIQQLSDLLRAKLFCFQALKEDYSYKKYLHIRAQAVLNESKTPSVKKEYKATTNHPILFSELRELRLFIAHENDLIPYQVFTQRSLYEMCEVLPSNKKSLLAISGMGKVRVQKYGEEILEIINHYCIENNLKMDAIILEEPKSKTVSKPKAKKGASNLISLQLFKDGLSVKEIAEKREYAIGTIESHLMKFIATGELKITDLISEEKYKELKKNILKTKFENLTELKNKIDSKFTYNELRMVNREIELEKSAK